MSHDPHFPTIYEPSGALLDTAPKVKGYWKQEYAKLLNGPWETNLATYSTALNNPYYAAANTTAYILSHGNFRGYEHLRETFFDPASKYFVGLRVHKERTRTDWSKGRYVTDWFVDRGMNDFERMYRACYAMLMISELPIHEGKHTSLKVFTLQNNLNIRAGDDADQTPQITSD